MNDIISLIKSLFPDTLTATIYILLSLAFVWLYKQFRTYIVEYQKNTITKTEKAIEVYSEFEAVIRKTLKERLDLTLIDQSITKVSSYLPCELLNEFDQLMECEDEEAKYDQLKKLGKKVRDEKMRLKHTQFDSVTYRTNGGFTDLIKVYYKTKLSTFIEPLIHTLINLFLLLMSILMTGLIAYSNDWTQKVFIVSILIAAMLFFLLIDIIFYEVLLKKRFIHTIVNWLIFGLFIVGSFFVIFLGQWYSGIIIIIGIFSYATYVAKCSIIKKGNIFTSN
ncbi:hypothetical protein [Paenibacillus sp. KN14-4R]|uniref:hypothetical protein n=1 Tax=Paenibacillus sp. KN14-4R TaxID=3445773 RepID=UPI003F9FD5F4